MAVVFYGVDDFLMLFGFFLIFDKDVDYVLLIFKFLMLYNLCLIGDGVVVYGFNVCWGWGLNGCIGVLVVFVKLLFVQVKVGDCVIILCGKMLMVGMVVLLI